MSERAQALAAQVHQVNGEIVAFIEQCPADTWRAVTQEEQWPVCVVCRHVARAFEVQPQVILMAASGQALPAGYTWEDIHRSNAAQAQEWARISMEDVLLPLRRYSHDAITMVSNLHDAQLDTVTKAPLDDSSMSVQQMVEGMIRHARTYLQSVRATRDRTVSG